MTTDRRILRCPDCGGWTWPGRVCVDGHHLPEGVDIAQLHLDPWQQDDVVADWADRTLGLEDR